MPGAIPFDLVLVRWRDAQHPRGEWSLASEIKADGSELEMVACGSLVKRTRKILVVAVCASCEDDPQVSGEMTIPVGCVIEVRTLVKASK